MVCGVHFGKSQHCKAVSTDCGREEWAKQAFKAPVTERKGWGSEREHVCAGEAGFPLNVYRRSGYQIHLELSFLSDARRQLGCFGKKWGDSRGTTYSSETFYTVKLYSIQISSQVLCSLNIHLCPSICSSSLTGCYVWGYIHTLICLPPFVYPPFLLLTACYIPGTLPAPSIHLPIVNLFILQPYRILAILLCTRCCSRL